MLQNNNQREARESHAVNRFIHHRKKSYNLETEALRENLRNPYLGEFGLS